MLPQTNYTTVPGEINLKDLFQTPPYAVKPIIPFLKAAGVRRVWEPAAFEGYLTRTLRRAGFEVTPTDLQRGEDFFLLNPPDGTDVHVTNAPFGCKQQWITKACHDGIPFMILVPTTTITLGWFDDLINAGFDLRCLMPNRHRIKFITPYKSDSNPQMHCSWITLGIPVGDQFVTRIPIQWEETEPISEEDRVCPPLHKKENYFNNDRQLTFFGSEEDDDHFSIAAD